MGTTVTIPSVTIPTPISPNPPAQATGFKSFLSHVGHAFKDVFAFLGSAQGQATISAVEAGTVAVATAINPAAGAAISGVEQLINSGLREAVSIETVAAAAGAQSGTGAQKAAAVMTAIAPQAGAFLQSIGITAPTATQVQALTTAINTGVVGILNSIPAPVATPAAQ